MTEPLAPAPGRAAFAFIFVTVLLDMLALGIIVPVLPELVGNSRAATGRAPRRSRPVRHRLGADAVRVLARARLAVGSLRRRPVILLSNLGLGLDYVLMAIAPTLRWLFVGRVISGITAASFSTAGAYIADVTPPEQRAAKFGMLGAAFGVGFIVGPRSAACSAHRPALPFWVAAG